MRIVSLFLCLCALFFSGCYDNEPKESEAGLPIGRVLLGGEDEEVFVDVEIAQTEAQRAEGLMNRESLADDAGMMFIYFEPTQSGFWMKNTLIPLSIAFIDDEQRIIQIMDMEPCTKDPCPTYTPDGEYTAALEVNMGAFDEWGIDVGDTVTILR
jgi:uncharacterized membrane protein (UPF0127 family)